MKTECKLLNDCCCRSHSGLFLLRMVLTSLGFNEVRKCPGPTLASCCSNCYCQESHLLTTLIKLRTVSYFACILTEYIHDWKVHANTISGLCSNLIIPNAIIWFASAVYCITSTTPASHFSYALDFPRPENVSISNVVYTDRWITATASWTVFLAVTYIYIISIHFLRLLVSSSITSSSK